MTSTLTSLSERLENSKRDVCVWGTSDLLSHSVVNSPPAMVVIGYDLTHRVLSLTFSLAILDSKQSPGNVLLVHGLKVLNRGKRSSQ